jgi:hypothetical protein
MICYGVGVGLGVGVGVGVGVEAAVGSRSTTMSTVTEDTEAVTPAGTTSWADAVVSVVKLEILIGLVWTVDGWGSTDSGPVIVKVSGVGWAETSS